MLRHPAGNAYTARSIATHHPRHSPPKHPKRKTRVCVPPRRSSPTTLLQIWFISQPLDNRRWKYDGPQMYNTVQSMSWSSSGCDQRPQSARYSSRSHNQVSIVNAPFPFSSTLPFFQLMPTPTLLFASRPRSLCDQGQQYPLTGPVAS